MLYRKILLLFGSFYCFNSPFVVADEQAPLSQNTDQVVETKAKRSPYTSVLRPMLQLPNQHFGHSTNNHLVSGFMLDENGQLRYTHAIAVKSSPNNARFIFARKLETYSRKAKN